MSLGAFLRKWTFREPVLCWTGYWCLAGLTVPFAVKWAVESSRTPEPKQPPSTREMLEFIRDQHRKQQQGAAQQ
ncbi:hypothetical protein Rsub_01251 [Raphidocelis subcapitata]|uniref:Uncharacterized protein n=1 Tax=Raphidocelis subcapitata TaxID=307507 RepID=A0A2V0NM47_9CHLO|nr:hypothetical protein Rsub_01251 [Raphidocelis subcapitata]|eukprot:GBF88536.1 hypothetical protein Rsub_01251 [Raphidocelis subcapitata]